MLPVMGSASVPWKQHRPFDDPVREDDTPLTQERQYATKPMSLFIVNVYIAKGCDLYKVPNRHIQQWMVVLDWAPDRFILLAGVVETACLP